MTDIREPAELAGCKFLPQTKSYPLYLFIFLLREWGDSCGKEVSKILIKHLDYFFFTVLFPPVKRKRKLLILTGINRLFYTVFIKLQDCFPFERQL